MFALVSTHIILLGSAATIIAIIQENHNLISNIQTTKIKDSGMVGIFNVKGNFPLGYSHLVIKMIKQNLFFLLCQC